MRFENVEDDVRIIPTYDKRVGVEMDISIEACIEACGGVAAVLDVIGEDKCVQHFNIEVASEEE